MKKGREEILKALSDFVDVGVVKRTELFSFDHQRCEASQEQMPREIGIKADKMPMKGTIGATGIKTLDKLLPEGWLSGATILIHGNPGAGKRIHAYQLIGEALKTGRKVCYVTFDRFPDEVRKNINQLGYNIKNLESCGSSLCFVDCYSAVIGIKSEEKYSNA